MNKVLLGALLFTILIACALTVGYVLNKPPQELQRLFSQAELQKKGRFKIPSIGNINNFKPQKAD